MVNPKTLGKLANSLTAYIQGLDAGEARRRINNAYLSEAMGHPWAHLIKHATIQTESAYGTGTLQLTTNGTNVVLTGGTWQVGWTTTPSNRRVAAQGRTEAYDITVTGANSGTLADPWLGDNLAAAVYSMWRDQYPLPGDCGYGKLVALWDAEQRFRLMMPPQPIFIRDSMTNEALVNFPDRFTIYSQSGETPPRPLIKVWPGPAKVRPYRLWYFLRPDPMVNDTDYPLWPFEFQDMLVESAMIEHYETQRFYSPKYLAIHRAKYDVMYRKMIKAFDGDSALDLIIEEVSTGRDRWTGGRNLYASLMSGFNSGNLPMLTSS